MAGLDDAARDAWRRRPVRGEGFAQAAVIGRIEAGEPQVMVE